MYRDQFRRCAGCSATLQKAGSVWSCRECNGMWIDASTFAEMVLTMQDPALAEPVVFIQAAGAQPRKCPECQSLMTHVSAHGLILDRCSEHGLWFDDGELAPLLEGVGNEKAPENDSFWLDFLDLLSAVSIG